MKNIFYRFLIGISSLVFIDTLTSQPINLRIAKNQVIKHYESGAFELECKKIIDDAINYLESNKKNFSNFKTVIFDVDDTVLHAFEHLKKLDFCDHCGDILFNEFVHRADAPTISQVKRLYDYCIATNYHIIFLTGRHQEFYDSTVKNLKLHGYFTFDRLICKSKQEKSLSPDQYKSSQRAGLVKDGFEIIACIGDQPLDFVGSHVGYAIKIPNYTHLLK